MTSNKQLLDWLEECKHLMQPDQTVLIDGSAAQLTALRREALATGEIVELNQQLLPGCYYHRSDPTDVARVENRTFICTEHKEDAGPNNNWMSPKQAREAVLPLFAGSMKGRTMYVIPYSMGAVGSRFAKIGVEVTDSIYVVLNMAIMTRVGAAVLEQLGDGPFVKGLHSKAQLSEENRYILHFPAEQEIWSVNSGYGGNALLGKKCFSLRIASTLARDEGWLAEHMLILGIERPDGETKYICAAFPSACGKTNLAMLIPPEGYREKGYKVWCVGDDIAWLRPGKDGRLYATNPENGFFGVAPGTSAKTNPNALAATRSNTIFTNVVRNLENNTVWWEGMDKNPPEHAEDWLGNPWNGKTATTKGAHPNARFTAPAVNCPCISPEFENPDGVPISAFVFGGRRAKTAPLVYESFDWKHGVFVGASMASETTAAASGAVGVVRRDPMAMLPFCGYNMGDYFGHWMSMEREGLKLPKVFHVNWFKLDEEGGFLWPGFGENLRVLDWMLARCEGKAEGVETPIGVLPRAEELDLSGLSLDDTAVEQLLSVDPGLWRGECGDIAAYFAQFGDRMPREMHEQLKALEQRLK